MQAAVVTSAEPRFRFAPLRDVSAGQGRIGVTLLPHVPLFFICVAFS
jgi:hypothetical protein